MTAWFLTYMYIVLHVYGQIVWSITSKLSIPVDHLFGSNTECSTSQELHPCPHLPSYDNYLCNQCLSPLMLWVPISIRARCTTLCDKVCQWLATGLWLNSPSPLVSSTNKIDCHDMTEILLKVALNTITSYLQGHSRLFNIF